MDEFYWRSHVPAFGSWNCNDNLPFTQCFQDRDLYVAGDLYETDVRTPAVIVVPRHHGREVYPKGRVGKKDALVVWDCDCRPAPKAVDEDLYKISPSLLRQQTKRKRGWGVFSRCLRPCVG